ncbi:type II toxin-antitoxin system CcdA family antitoxin [Hellea sp.]|nr:type II toxin-antitoxin system CcdA family antitoxin [Hellea sp.]
MRMNYAHKRFPKKKAVNLSLSEDLIETAKANNINLSEYVEHRIQRELRTLKLESWAKDNASAIQSTNEFAEKSGLLSDVFWSDDKVD